MELVSAARRAIDAGPGAADPAVREAAETLAIMLSLFAPYTAEECWEMLGHEPSVARAGWPAADPALLVEDTVTCVVQVDGKVRDRLEVRDVGSARTSCASWRWLRLAWSGLWPAAASAP